MVMALAQEYLRLLAVCWYLAIPPVRLPYQQCSKYRATVVAHLFFLPSAHPQAVEWGRFRR